MNNYIKRVLDIDINNVFTNHRIRMVRNNNGYIPWRNLNGLSDENDYVPIFATTVNKGVYGGKIIHYGVPQYTVHYSGRNSPYNTLLLFFKNYSILYPFKTRSMVNPIYAMKGLIVSGFDTNNVPIIEMMVVFKPSYIKDYRRKNDSPDLSQFALLINRDFKFKPELKTVYNKINKEIIDPMSLAGVDIIITKDIIGKTFNNNLKVPKFDTIEDFSKYLNEFNTKVINGE